MALPFPSVPASVPASGTLQLGWWNTRLAPWRGNRHVFADNANQVRVAGVVASHLFQEGVDVLALGEADTEAARRVAAGTGFEILHEVRGWGIQILHNPARVEVVFHQQIDAELANRDTSRATQLLVQPRGAQQGALLVFIVVHWPSRRMDEAHIDRKRHAQCLQSHVNRLLRQGASDIVIGGDFNDEPWDASMLEGLMGTRERSFACNNKRALYNPFFRLAGEHHPCDLNGDTTGAGTYYWDGGKTARWWTFDQFLFSQAIVKGERWHLLESLTGIRHAAALHDSLVSDKLFDHYPIVASLAY